MSKHACHRGCGCVSVAVADVVPYVKKLRSKGKTCQLSQDRAVALRALLHVRLCANISNAHNLPDAAELNQNRHQGQERLYEREHQKARRDISNLLHGTEQLCVDIEQAPHVQQLHAVSTS